MSKDSIIVQSILAAIAIWQESAAQQCLVSDDFVTDEPCSSYCKPMKIYDPGNNQPDNTEDPSFFNLIVSDEGITSYSMIMQGEESNVPECKPSGYEYKIIAEESDLSDPSDQDDLWKYITKVGNVITFDPSRRDVVTGDYAYQ